MARNHIMQHTAKRKKGLSIVELIIYMGLLSILLVVLTDVFVSIIDVRKESEAVSAVEQDGNYILARLFYDVSRASSISTPASLGASTSSLLITIGGVNYTYSLNGSNLQLVNNNGTDVLNSINTTVSSPTFLRIGNSGGKNTIQISFTVSSVTQRNHGPETKTYQTSVGLR